MSARDVQSHNNGNGRVGQSRLPCQSAWMAHWSDSSWKTAGRASLSFEPEVVETDISMFAKESRKVNDVTTAKITDERLVASSQNLRREQQNKPFPMLNFRESNERALALKTSQTSIFGIAFQTNPISEAETPPKNSDFQRLEKTVKFHNFFEKSSLAASRPSKDDFTGSTPRNLPFGVTSSAPLLSMRIGEEMSPSSYNLASKEHIGPDFSLTRQNGVKRNEPFELQFGSQMTRDSIVSPKFKGKMLCELLSLSQDNGFQTRQGVKLQLLGSSTDSEEKETSGKFKTSLFRLRNESSADTDTMERKAQQEDRLSGMTSCPSNKDVDVGQVSPLSRVDAASAREGAGQRLLDINQRLPELPAARSTDDRDTSSSRTESLDVERLFSNPEQAGDSRSNAWQDSLSGSDPSSRWIKRIKLTASDSPAHGTKSSHMPEVPSREKVNKDGIKLDQTVALLRNAEVSNESDRKILDTPLAHSWIRRWCHNQATTTTQKGSEEAEVTCEPESFKETSDKFQKKQFPSIAAMALMGKAMKRFRPCQFQNLGPSVVWNTERF